MTALFFKKYILKRSWEPSHPGKGTASFIRFTLFASSLIFVFPLNAQFVIDSTYIKRFEKENDVEVYTGVKKALFRFRDFAEDDYISQHKLSANTSAYAGFTIDYNWLSLDFSRNIPNTAVSNQTTSIKVLGVHFRRQHNNFLFEAGTHKYKGLILEVNRRQRDFHYYDKINYRCYYTSVTYILNAERFSLRAAKNYSLLQAKSAGSFMATISPVLQRFTLKDSFDEYEKQDSAFLYQMSRKPASLNVLIRAGYTYNFIFEGGKWSINPGLFAGPALEKRAYPDKGHKFKFIANYQAILNCGYNSPGFYFHLNAFYNSVVSHMINSKMSIKQRGASFTIGYRIGKLKNKILGVL